MVATCMDDVISCDIKPTMLHVFDCGIQYQILRFIQIQIQTQIC